MNAPHDGWKFVRMILWGLRCFAAVNVWMNTTTMKSGTGDWENHVDKCFDRWNRIVTMGNIRISVGIYMKHINRSIHVSIQTTQNILHCQKGKYYLALCELLELNDVHHKLPPSHTTSIPRSCSPFPSSSHFSHCNSLILPCLYLILCTWPTLAPKTTQ